MFFSAELNKDNLSNVLIASNLPHRSVQASNLWGGHRDVQAKPDNPSTFPWEALCGECCCNDNNRWRKWGSWWVNSQLVTHNRLLRDSKSAQIDEDALPNSSFLLSSSSRQRQFMIVTIMRTIVFLLNKPICLMFPKQKLTCLKLPSAKPPSTASRPTVTLPWTCTKSTHSLYFLVS